MTDNKKPMAKYRYCHLCGRTGNVTFSFPTQCEKRMEKWLQFCNLSANDKLLVPFLCEKHFDAKLITKNQKRTLLNNSAIPTIQKESTNSLQREKPSTKKQSNYYNYCCICGPTDRHLHKFPKDENRRNQWLDALNLKEDKRKYLKVCDFHFPPGSLLQTPGGKILLRSDTKPVICPTENEMININPITSVINCIASASNSTKFSADCVTTSDSVSSMLNTTSTIEPSVSPTNIVTSTLSETIWNQHTLEKFRGALLHLSNQKRNEIVTSEIVNIDCDINISSIDREMNPIEDNVIIDHISEEENADTNIRKISEEIMTPRRTLTNSASKRSIRYLGDIDTPSLESPDTRKKCLCVIRTQRRIMGLKIKQLKQENDRLKAKISKLKSLLADVRQKNMITKRRRC